MERTDRGPSPWATLYCTERGCRGERWLVQQDSRARELWHIAASEEIEPWQVAAAAPICPLCGGALAAHREGVGDPEMAIDNPFVGYIKALRTAA